MKSKFIFFMFFTFCQFIFAQKGFQFETNKKKIVIPFKLINNLIFIPIEVNGVELNFLLDTGVEETILLSLEDKNINLNNIEKIKLRGLGSEQAVDGLKSTSNVLKINDLIDKHHDLFIVLDQNFNFSTHVGIPVNGIIGYSLFKNNLVEINYMSKKIIIYNDLEKIQKKINKKYTSIPISIERSKPYAQAKVTLNDNEISAKLLLDLGNSDAIWLFQGINPEIQVPSKNFNDYLGKGFSGEVTGKRTKITKFKLEKFEFENPIIAMPDTSSIKSVTMVANRVGSIGGEIFKRFSVIFDYKNSRVYLKQNSQYKQPFSYNMSGIELQNEGMQWVQETIPIKTVNSTSSTFYQSENTAANNFKYKFSLKPIYTIANVRKNSPAELCGLKKGDVIIKINNSLGYKYSLEEINNILKSEEGKWIKFEIERNNKALEFKFQLKSIL